MRTRVPLALAMAGASALGSGAQGASLIFGGEATVRAGYGKNPSFDTVHTGTSAVYGGNLTAGLTRLTGNGRTTLTGSADFNQAAGGNGRTENYRAQLGHQQQVNARLTVIGDVAYSETNNPGAPYSTESRDLVPIGDILTIGTKTRTISGDVNAAYQLDAKDLFQAGLNASRSTYSTANASAYTQYGGSFGYLRTISSATRVGVQFSALKVVSDRFSSSSSYSGGLVLTQKIDQHWTFQGGVNGVLQQAFGGNFKTLGFNGSLCGDYPPRITVCFLGSRQSAASGIGGLRIDTQFGTRVGYRISTRSTLSASATFDISKAKDIVLPAQHYIDGAIEYRRTITPRLSAGVSARYQRRTTKDIPLVFTGFRTESYVGTVDVSYRFGRNS